MPPEAVFGLLNVNKPAGPTSHDIVALVRRGTGIRRVGHAGTLDPLASGVLVLCLGAATRLSEYAMRSPKRYRARIRLGLATDTDDATGRVIAEYSTDRLTQAQVETALATFRGEITQLPPAYSAIKQGGRKLYELARAGQPVDAAPRLVTIHRLDLLECDLPFLTLDVDCSPGTYIRSLARDLGEALGVGAHLAALVRLASGPFRIEDAVPLDVLRAAMQDGSWRNYLLAPDLAVRDLPAVTLDDKQAGRIRHGSIIPAPPDAAGEYRACDATGALLAILEAKDGRWRPVKVFVGAGE